MGIRSMFKRTAFCTMILGGMENAVADRAGVVINAMTNCIAILAVIFSLMAYRVAFATVILGDMAKGITLAAMRIGCVIWAAAYATERVFRRGMLSTATEIASSWLLRLIRVIWIGRISAARSVGIVFVVPILVAVGSFRVLIIRFLFLIVIVRIFR